MRIETLEDAASLIQVDRNMEVTWFWEQLDCNPDAIAQLCMVMCRALGCNDPAFALSCMEVGARIAIRADVVGVATQDEKGEPSS